MTPQDAKEFLIERIIAQTEHDGVTLGEPELKMLYFSEAGPDEFERKIRGVIRNARAAAEESDEGEAWENAVETLRWEDTWLPRLIDLAGKPVSGGQLVRGMVIAAVIVGVVMMVIVGVFRGNLR